MSHTEQQKRGGSVGMLQIVSLFWAMFLSGFQLLKQIRIRLYDHRNHKRRTHRHHKRRTHRHQKKETEPSPPNRFNGVENALSVGLKIRLNDRDKD
eukprot:72528_1